MDEVKPKLVDKGRYAIYETAAGEGVVSYRPDGKEADNCHVIPSKFWGVLRKMMSGEQFDMSPAALMKLMVGR